MSVGEKMKQRRKELKISADEIAEKLNVSRSTIFRYEKGDIEKLPTNILNELAVILKTSPAFLMGWENPNKNDITSIYNELEPPRQQKVYNYAEYELREQKNKIAQFPSKGNSELKLYSERTAKEQILEEIDLLGSVSAGTGEFVLEEHVEKVLLPENIIPHAADFCLIVNGDSMEPVILDGSYVFIDKTNEIPSGTISAVVANGESYVKRVWFENGHARLESFNDKYEDIIVTEEDEFCIIGKVVM